jgi:hypothetical protein
MEDKKQNQEQAGFALLVSIIVVSVVVSIGLVLLDVTTKQLRLSSNSTDSELAFHAANAGMECARYVRRQASAEIEGDEFAFSSQVPPGADIDLVSCFGASMEEYSKTTLSASGDGDAILYEYEFSWASDRCSEVDMVVVVADLFESPGVIGSGVTISNADMRSLIPGYPRNQALVCPAASYCTVISVKGYNRSCNNKDSFGTVQREVLLEF